MINMHHVYVDSYSVFKTFYAFYLDFLGSFTQLWYLMQNQEEAICKEIEEKLDKNGDSRSGENGEEAVKQKVGRRSKTVLTN